MLLGSGVGELSRVGEVRNMCFQAARVSADAVAAAVTLTNDCIKDGNAVEATSKAAASAWRSSQARSPSQCSSHPEMSTLC